MQRTRAISGSRARGISLMEVMVSIGIAAVGLLGVAALMPLAARQADQSNSVDRAAEAGRRAFRDLYVRGMHDHENWLEANGNGVAVTSNSMCFDPRLVAAKIFRNSDSGTGISPTFPSNPLRWDGSTAALAVARKTLRASHPSKQAATQAKHAMRIGQANELFTYRDDLLFRDTPGKENDKTVPPEQVTLDSKKRDSQRRFSWYFFANPVSRYDFALYKFTVVVIRDRDPALDDTNVTTPDERVAGVTFHSLNGAGTYAIGGGEVTLKVDETSNASDSSEIDTPVGSWVCLMGLRVDGSGSLDTNMSWYRVAGAQPPVYNAGDTTWSRRVTLEGPDWKLGATSPASAVDQCVLVRGAMGVYEKTLRLQSPSLYRP